ncbi:GlxA family transcriptional regulator [Microbacterium panaciterrae]|uniref:Helix-turn-helix domain-containing protein n=1 Tax=Microbacterium panaciterrae TaxID=985759 RepID=A0ABP8PUK3_9MICO
MTRQHRVVVLAFDGVYPFDLGIPSRVLGAADGRYDVKTCSFDGRPVRTSADFDVNVRHSSEVLRQADTVIIPGFTTNTPDLDATRNAARALTRVRRGTRLASICTGAFVLGAAGLLDGKRATTHWAAAPLFRQWYPAVHLDPDALFVDEDNTLTSAGAAAGVDLCLQLIRNDHGNEFANHVARMCVVPGWREGGQRPYMEGNQATNLAEGTSAVREWARRNLHEAVSLTALADQAHVSQRTLARRFQHELGMSPGRWLTQERIQRARQLLETTSQGIDEIASRVGFAGATSLREHFRASVGLTPQAYRRSFRDR